MEPFQPFLIALLAVLLAVSAALLVLTLREQRQRDQNKRVIDAAIPRMLARLAAIADPSIGQQPEPKYQPPPVALASRRRVWRDATAGLVVFACIGLVLVFALPTAGRPVHVPTAPPTEVAVASDAPTDAATLPAIAFAPSPLPTRVEIVLPTEVPTPTLPVTKTPRPTERVTTAARAAPPPTPRPTPKPTAKPKPKPTPMPQPIARFGCSFQGGLTVGFDSTSRYATSYAWDFDGDGTSGAADPTHTFSGSGGYRVSLTVTNASGSDSATKFIDLDAGTGCS